MMTTATEPRSPTERLAEWRAEQAGLTARLETLKQSNSLLDLDALAAIEIKLSHITARLPDLEREALAYEQAERQAAFREQDAPKWAAASAEKRESLAQIVHHLEGLLQAIAQYKDAHGTQVFCLRTIELEVAQRSSYQGLWTQMLQACAIVASGNPTGREWLSRLRSFDGVGRQEVLPADGSQF